VRESASDSKVWELSEPPNVDDKGCEGGASGESSGDAPAADGETSDGARRSGVARSDGRMSSSEGDGRGCAGALSANASTRATFLVGLNGEGTVAGREVSNGDPFAVLKEPGGDASPKSGVGTGVSGGIEALLEATAVVPFGVCVDDAAPRLASRAALSLSAMLAKT